MVALFLREEGRGLVGESVSLRVVIKPMNKDATAFSANRFAEPAWRTLKLLFAISYKSGC